MDQSKSRIQTIKNLLGALLCSWVVTAVLLLVLALLLWKLNLKEGQISVGITVTYLLSCFAGGWVLGRRTQKRKFLFGILLGVCYFLLLLAISMIASGRAASASGNPDFSGTLRGGRNGGRNAFVKKYFKNESRCDIISTIKYYKGGVCHETHQNFKYKKLTEYNEKRRMRRVPDILSVCMQDILYSRKSELRTYKIKCVQHCSAVSGEIRRVAAGRSEKQCSRREL